ncbi:hypothetical protein [Salipiger thiooxidans]|uniref:hypothetical protein n=1 Tax=Salipiger thiooxidans TaxID=282683 RepID=UPI001F5DE5A5|nr:hypothetical protein [Salipiger thiooxidans]
MNVTAIRTFRAEEFANVLWVHIETDAGITGLGETFYGAEAREAHIHNALAGRLLGQDPLNIELLYKEMVSQPNAQSSTGVEYRAASAVDIALRNIFGKVADLPVHRVHGGQSWERSESTTPALAPAMCVPMRSSQSTLGLSTRTPRLTRISTPS